MQEGWGTEIMVESIKNARFLAAAIQTPEAGTGYQTETSEKPKPGKKINMKMIDGVVIALIISYR